MIKRLIVFILISFISLPGMVMGCGPYYPSNEDIRFSIFNPDYFGFKDYVSFYYSGYYFAPMGFDLSGPYKQDKIETSYEENINLWRKRYQNIPTEADVYETIYQFSNRISEMPEGNSFVKCLYQSKDTDAIDYLNFAKKTSSLNTWLEDPWERSESAALPQRKNLIRQALSCIKRLKDEELKLRYAFIAMRLAHYNGDYALISTIYEDQFSKRREKNILDYWSLYFKAIHEPDSIVGNYEAALVFANAPDKRFNIRYSYDQEIPVERTLALAKNDKEREAIWLIEGINNPARALETMRKIYALNPESEGLSFLLLREINKLEDWIYTPYYTNFVSPTMEEPVNYSDNYYSKNLNRIRNDRAYAGQVADFVHQANLKKVNRPLLWESSLAYLQLMTENYAASLSTLGKLKKKTPERDTMQYQWRLLRGLCLTAMQKSGEAIIPEEVKSLLLQEDASMDKKFVFAIARELEYKGNTTDGAILLSKLKEGNEFSYGKGSYWRTKLGHNTLFVDYYDDYFFYLDAQYTPDQMRKLISAIESASVKSKFDQWKNSAIKKDLPRLYDLMGTKYIRKNDLTNALRSFEKVNDSLWTSAKYPYLTYLNANPFYCNMYSAHAPNEADTIRYNKLSITRTLINYLAKANDVNNKDRDYYYFLVANCYLNMTYHGNSWMMRRYYWTTNGGKTKIEDDAEYFNADLAKQYYLKSKSVTRSGKFAALCLRMAGRCEKHRLNNMGEKWNNYNSWEDLSSAIFEANRYYKQIKKEYPDDYEALIGNCESFEPYFNARKKK
jgi:hypothetical protein